MVRSNIFHSALLGGLLRLTVFSAALGFIPLNIADAQVVVAPGETLTVPPDIHNQIRLGDGATLNVQTGGTVNNAGDAVIDTVNGTTIIVTNDGTISSTGADAIFANGSALFATNSGTITGGLDGLSASTLASLTNSGLIAAGDDGVHAITLTSLIRLRHHYSRQYRSIRQHPRQPKQFRHHYRR